MTAVDLMGLAASRPVHFIGVGGAGMYPLAELVLRTGGSVSGCDVRESAATRRLQELGADVQIGHDPSHVAAASAVVASSAVPAGHPEVEAARAIGLPVLKRARAMADIVHRGRVVAVAGTHGKTTTAAMVTSVLTAGGLDPTALVGGAVPEWAGHLRLGRPDVYVVEADEYDRSFHALRPDAAVVTNLEADHLDVFGDLEGVRAAFRTFVGGARPGARIAVCADDPEASRLLGLLPVAGYGYGLSAGSQLRAVDVTPGTEGTRCRVLEEGRDGGNLEVRVPGLHNLRNALAASAVGRYFGVPWDAVREGLRRFTGVARRLQRVGEVEGVLVIDDYAHHPTELEATLAAVRIANSGRRVVALFQPHLFSRTRDFADAFGRVLAAGADVVWVTDVYPAREEPIPGITGQTVVDAVRRHGGSEIPVRYHPPLEGLASALADELRPGDVIVSMGAGSVEAVPAELTRRLGEVARA